jgi:trans-aconitate methyltransferase
MTQVFGEVAALYDDIRPGYPGELLAAITEFHGGTPVSVADIGAGTGKGTDLLVRLGVPVVCVEPDPRMGAVLEAKFPQVEVVNATFEEWVAPPGGVGLIASATAWHWTDAATRNPRAYEALAPGGTLAVFHNRHGYADQTVADAISAVLQAIDPTPGLDDRSVHWATDDARDSGLFADVRELQWHQHPVFTTEQYLQLTQTFSPYRRHSQRDRQRALSGLTEVLEGFGGAITMDILTVLTLARRP